MIITDFFYLGIEERKMKRRKIICTMGPATNNREAIRQLPLNEMNVTRFKFMED